MANTPEDDMPVAAEPHAKNGATFSPPNVNRERLRFADFKFDRTPAGTCNVRVTLEYDGVMYEGRASGQSGPLGDFRMAAEAMLHALEHFTTNSIRFELVGVKHLRAFDANLIIVSVIQHEGDKANRLVGCCLADEDVKRGAALAVLNATNRVLGNYIAMR